MLVLWSVLKGRRYKDTKAPSCTKNFSCRFVSCVIVTTEAITDGNHREHRRIVRRFQL